MCLSPKKLAASGASAIPGQQHQALKKMGFLILLTTVPGAPGSLTRPLKYLSKSNANTNTHFYFDTYIYMFTLHIFRCLSPTRLSTPREQEPHLFLSSLLPQEFLTSGTHTHTQSKRSIE